MKDSPKAIVDLLLRMRKARKTDGARLTLKHAENFTQYTDIFVWQSSVPNEAHFSTNVVVGSGITISAVVKALKSTRFSCIVASFLILERPSHNLDLPQSLAALVEGVSHVQLYEFWTSNLSWNYFHRLFPVRAPQVWQSLTSITLGISVDTLEDQASCMGVLTKGDLRSFLSQLPMLQHLSLVFSSELLGHEVLCSHAPLGCVLPTPTPWSNLQSIHLDGFESTAQELVEFLGVYCATLKSVTLRNCFLLSGSWIYLLPELRELLSLEEAEVSGAVEGFHELWLVKTPEYRNDCMLSECLTHWLTHPEVASSCPLSRRNLVWNMNPQEDDWE
jgi:hypothetical protein